MSKGALLPERLKAPNGITFRIDLVSHKKMAKIAGLGRDQDCPLGMTLVLEDRILLLKDMGDGQRRLTLWHEVIHVAAFFGASQGHGTVLEGADPDEVMASSLDSVLLDLMRWNPEVMSYLL